MPGVDLEPENAAREPEDWNDDLEVAALDDEVNRLLASEGDSDSELGLAAGAILQTTRLLLQMPFV